MHARLMCLIRYANCCSIIAHMPAEAQPAAPPRLTERETVLHSWCMQSEWNAPTIVGGEGARLFTADGRSILDMSSLAECSNHGHQHPRVIAAIRAQAGKLCFVTSAWGTDANEHAVKFARAASGKPRGWIVTRDRSYHGASYAAMALSGDARTSAQSDP